MLTFLIRSATVSSLPLEPSFVHLARNLNERVVMQEAAKGFRWLKAHKKCLILPAAMLAHQVKHSTNKNLEQQAKAA